MIQSVALSEQKRLSLQESVVGKSLLNIIDNQSIQIFFQPIVDLKTQKIFSFEALSRGPVNTSFFSPLNLFNAAIEQGCLLELDYLTRQLAMQNFASRAGEHQHKAKLFLNVSVSTIMSDSHEEGVTLSYIKNLDLDPQDVVIEITELQPIEDPEVFMKAIHHYRKMGFKVAIDDLGSGYNGLKLWTDVKPDFVKIDKHFVDDIDEDSDKYHFIETVMTLANSLGTKIIVEGVETEPQLKVLEELGVDYVQGYLFKKPEPSTALTLNYEWKASNKAYLGPQEVVSSIVEKTLSMPCDCNVEEVANYLLENPAVEHLVVLNEQKPVGIVWRREIMDILASKFGRDLYFRKTIDKVMDKAPLIFEKDTPLVEVSHAVTEMDSTEKSAFIVQEKDQYLGTGSFMALLRIMTNLRVKNAEYANPLSGLPGNVPIQNKLQACLNSNSLFSIIYIDVDNFKPYNDYYSFEQGDGVITCISNVLQKVTDDKLDFIGHVGGDDFIIIREGDKVKKLCKAVLSEFESHLSEFYTAEDFERKSIVAKNREDVEVSFPLMSLSLGVLIIAPGIYQHTQKLASVVTKAKKMAKKTEGNSFFILDSSDTE